jgi:hypothetical protein
MSYFKLHKERKKLQEKLPYLVEKEMYEDASDIKKLIQLSFDNPRKFLKENISNFDDNQRRIDIVALYDSVERIVMSTDVYHKKSKLKNVSYLDGYNYHKEIWGSYPINDELMNMINEDIGKDSSLLKKINHFILSVFECDLDIENLEENKTYNRYKKFIEESERKFDINYILNYPIL